MMSDQKQRREAPANAWDRLERETDPAYAAFRVYLEAGPEQRSIVKVVDHRTKTGQGKSRSPVSGWATKHRWKARAEAFDAEGAARTDETIFELLESRGRRQAEIAVRILDALEVPILELERRAGTPEKLEELLGNLEPEELIRLVHGSARALPRVVQTERLARGQSTTNVGGHDGGPIETESRVAAEKWAAEAPDSELEAFLLGAETQRAIEEKPTTKPPAKAGRKKAKK